MQSDGIAMVALFRARAAGRVWTERPDGAVVHAYCGGKKGEDEWERRETTSE